MFPSKSKQISLVNSIQSNLLTCLRNKNSFLTFQFLNQKKIQSYKKMTKKMLKLHLNLVSSEKEKNVFAIKILNDEKKHKTQH